MHKAARHQCVQLTTEQTLPLYDWYYNLPTACSGYLHAVTMDTMQLHA